MKKFLSLVISAMLLFSAITSTSLVASAVDDEPYVTDLNFPSKMKIGERLPELSITYKNLPPSETVVFTGMNRFWSHPFGGGSFIRDTFVEGAWGDTPDCRVDSTGTCSLVYGKPYPSDNLWDQCTVVAVKSGIAQHQPGFILWSEYESFNPSSTPASAFTNVGDPIEIIIEEPIITSNAPANIRVGESIDFSTNLTNTALTDSLIADYEAINKKTITFNPETIIPVFYKPAVTIIEGDSLVSQSNENYTNTLHSSETLTFNKAGTVKIKIVYEKFLLKSKQDFNADGSLVNNEVYIGIYTDDSANPEKIITINVTGDSLPTTPDGEDPVNISDPDTGIKLEAEPGVVPSDTTIKIEKVTEGGNFTIINNALNQTSDKWVAFDISLISEGIEIQPNGKVKMTIPRSAWQGFNMNKMVLCHIAEDGTKTQIPFTLDSTRDNIIFETDHFSLYALAEIEDEQISNNNNDTSGNENPKTGAIAPFALKIAVMMLSVAGLFFVAKKCKTIK